MDRRTFLRRATVVGGVALAGCGGDPDDLMARVAARPATTERLAALTLVGPFAESAGSDGGEGRSPGASGSPTPDGTQTAGEGSTASRGRTDIESPRPRGGRGFFPSGRTPPDEVSVSAVESFLDRLPFESHEEVTIPYAAFDDGLSHRGTVYDLDRTELRTETLVDYEIAINYTPNDELIGTVDYANLSARDRAALSEAIPVPEDTREEFAEAGITPGVQETPNEVGPSYVDLPSARYNATEREGSRLIDPEGGHARGLVYNGSTFRLSIEAVHEEAVEVHQFSLAGRQPVEEYAADLREQYRVRLDDLPEDQRTVLDEASSGSYDVLRKDDAAEALRERLASAEPLPVYRREVAPIVTPSVEGDHYLVRYDGSDLVVAWHEQGRGNAGLG